MQPRRQPTLPGLQFLLRWARGPRSPEPHTKHTLAELQGSDHQPRRHRPTEPPMATLGLQAPGSGKSTPVFKAQFSVLCTQNPLANDQLRPESSSAPGQKPVRQSRPRAGLEGPSLSQDDPSSRGREREAGCHTHQLASVARGEGVPSEPASQPRTGAPCVGTWPLGCRQPRTQSVKEPGW